MKNLLLACFVIFSFEEAFSQTGYKDTDREVNKRARIGDQVVTGQSSTARRVTPAGAQRVVKKDQSIQGVNCVDDSGKSIAPNAKGYTKCVDNANRIK